MTSPVPAGQGSLLLGRRSARVTSALAVCVLALLSAASLCAAEQVTIGPTPYSYGLFWAVNCYNGAAGKETSEVWSVYNPSSADKTQPDSKYYVSTKGTVQWEGNPVSVTGLGARQDMSGVFNLNKLAHSKADETLVGTLDFAAQNLHLPCYSFNNDKVDFFNGWVCYRLYACSTVDHIVTDVALSGETIPLDMFAFGDLIRGANFQSLVSPNYQGTVGNQEGDSYIYEVSVGGNAQMDWAIQAITAKAGSIGQGIVNQYNPNIIGGQLDLPKAVTIVTYVGLRHDKYIKYDIYFTGVAKLNPPSGACAAGLNTAGGVASVLSGALAVAAVAAAPETGGASLLAVGSGVLGAGSGGFSLASTWGC
eukprot:TRINITY_DN57_c0_g1_i3.p1 TRINITY_DN57_c0_g1~~TRINITY_DN57_c0_g1_i3.p1  ORF type:complete len:365 (+),score=92.00 TRINITY_DN57_c0_g1_i3:398-1492(+)